MTVGFDFFFLRAFLILFEDGVAGGVKVDTGMVTTTEKSTFPEGSKKETTGPWEGRIKEEDEWKTDNHEEKTSFGLGSKTTEMGRMGCLDVEQIE